MSSLLVPNKPNSKLVTKKIANNIINHLYMIVKDKHDIELCEDVLGIMVSLMYSKGAIDFKDTLYSLRHYGGICIYNFDRMRWFSAVYIAHWPSTKKIAVRYISDDLEPFADKFFIIEDFPVNFVKDNPELFENAIQHLNLSNLSTEQMELCERSYNKYKIKKR